MAKVISEFAGAVGKTGRIAANCTNAVDEDKGDISEEVHEDEDELHAWCLLEERERAVARSHLQQIKIEGEEEEVCFMSHC